MSARIYANDETRREIQRLLRLARRVTAMLGVRLVVDPKKARLIDFTKGQPKPKEDAV